jgi:hypothetical protein
MHRPQFFETDSTHAICKLQWKLICFHCLPLYFTGLGTSVTINVIDINNVWILQFGPDIKSSFHSRRKKYYIKKSHMSSFYNPKLYNLYKTEHSTQILVDYDTDYKSHKTENISKSVLGCASHKLVSYFLWYVHYMYMTMDATPINFHSQKWLSEIYIKHMIIFHFFFHRMSWSHSQIWLIKPTIKGKYVWRASFPYDTYIGSMSLFCAVP